MENLLALVDTEITDKFPFLNSFCFMGDMKNKIITI